MKAATGLRPVIDLRPARSELARESLEGLRAHPKDIPSKVFYDDRGSALFEEIVELPEYYPTRTEIGILERNVDAMARRIGPVTQLTGLACGAVQASVASRRPEKAQRAAGGKKFRYVVRTWPGGVTHAPPRSTIWLLMNLPLYSPSAPASGTNRG